MPTYFAHAVSCTEADVLCASVFVEAGFVPNAIQFITYSRAYRPCARPKVFEAFSVGVPLGYLQIQDPSHRLVITRISATKKAHLQRRRTQGS
jgi:hypothetical protein